MYTASTPEAELKCLRNIPMKALKSLAVEYERQVGGEDGMDVFIPISPSTFIPDSPSKLVATGQFSRNIDIISGWNEDDGSFSIPTTIVTDKDLALFVKYEYATYETRNYLFALNQTLFRDIYAAVDMSWLGVSHFSDIPYVFNQARGYGEYASAKDLALSSEVSGSWAAFAALGQPSQGPGTVPGWDALRRTATISFRSSEDRTMGLV
jgi:carboxylesterase type B